MSARPDIYDHLENGPMPGGCDSCDAYLTAEVPCPGVYIVHVRHDDRCPVLRARAAGSN